MPFGTYVRPLLIALALALASAGLLASTASAAPKAVLGASYAAAPPKSAGAGTTMQVPVTVTNTGDEAWASTGATPVNLSHHWYNPDGTVVVWEGPRTSLGQVVAPGGSKTVTALVPLPPAAGQYLLRFHLVKEGVAWFPQMSQPYIVTASDAYAVKFGTVPIFTYVAGQTYTVKVPVTNTGTSLWNATGTNPITLSYHWHDAQGRTVVWDGLRTKLKANVAPGATTTIDAVVVAPASGTGYTLTFDMVREGVNWFGFLGGTPVKISTNVEAIRYGARYVIAATTAAYFSQVKTVPVTVTNTGNIGWNAAGSDRVSLSYHLFDSTGKTVVWDGLRTPLGTDLAAGQSRTLNLQFAAPAGEGTYSLNVDAVREGISWLSGYGVPASSTRLTVTSGFSIGYGATTTPAQASLGAQLDLTVAVTNYGPRPLTPTGTNPTRLSYHIHRADGRVVVWDGARGVFSKEVLAGQTLVVPIKVTLPAEVGDYRISWDIVQEGVAWLSGYGVTMKVEPFSVVPGVTFYGKGFGHGVGMSQHGAQGYATGAFGPRLTGEQIIQKYYTGTQITQISTLGRTGASTGIRVLLSVPSSTGIYTCGGMAMNTQFSDIKSTGGFLVLNEGAGNAPVGSAKANEPWQIAARNGRVEVWRNIGTPTKIYDGAGPIVLTPLDGSKPIWIQQKGTYRGNLRFTNQGDRQRVINFVNYDDYAKGVIRKEMLKGWHHEAYKAQAYAAKAYGYTSYRGVASDYDVRDDQLDQCYGGVGAEEPESNLAVDATRGRIPTYSGAVIRAYFSSSSGGYTVADGCWGPRLRLVNGRYQCGASQPYLQAVRDPADTLVSSPAPNRHASWQVTFTSAQIRTAVLNMRGVDIGSLRSVDVTNVSPEGGHVVSILVRGSLATVDVQADVFLRTHLSLKSTFVRLNPF